MALIVTFLGLFALTIFAPDTTAGRFLHRAFVELPARSLARIGRGHVITVAVVAVAFAWLDKELVLAISMTPEAIAWLAMIDIGMLVDAAIGVMFVATTARFPRVAIFLRGMRPRARTTRARRPQRPTPSNDDEDGAGLALAA